MEFKSIRIVILMLFVLLAGTLYSCNSNKGSDIISLESSSEDSLEDSSENKFISNIDENTEKLEESASTNSNANQLDKSSSNNNPELEEEKQIKENLTENSKLIYVHISGAVNVPGVYAVEEQTRIYELIEIAGDLSIDAAGDYINQAATLMDSQQVYIPTKEEVEESRVWIPTDPPNIGVLPKEEGSSNVNINTASKEELMTLAGIGESKAKSIIEYREKHGGFKRKEDIMNISGIKQAAYSKISENITVD